MAMTQKTKNRLEETIAELKAAKHISLGDRDDYIELLTEAAEGTNGLTVEEKVQANAVNTFNLCYLMLRGRLDGAAAAGFWPSLFRLIRDCKRELMWLGFGITALCAFRPQGIQVFESIFGR